MPPVNQADPLFRFVQGGRAGYIDVKGKIVIPPSLEPTGNWSQWSRGPATTSIGNDEAAEPFSEGLAVVATGERSFVYLNPQGQQALPERFPLASRFFHGLAHVKLPGAPGSRAASRTSTHPAAPFSPSSL
jgi:hypothetical protein